MGEITIRITTPVNPASRKFITHIYAGAGNIIPEIPKYFGRDLSKLASQLGLKIKSIIGDNKYIKGVIILEYDSNTKKPLKLFTKELEIYTFKKTYEDPIIIENNL
jgi:hypothetical protein